MAYNKVLVWGFSNNRAGTETVIYNYAKSLPNVAFDFLCYNDPLNYSNLFTPDTNNRYFVIPIKIKHPLAYTCALKKFMKEHGREYSVLWCNINDVSNIDVLKYAKKYGIKRRITHIHTSQMANVFITKVFSRLNYKKCLNLATDRWACSESAGHFLYGDLPFRVIPNAIDAKRRCFDQNKREAIRKQWNIQNEFVVGTVGRLADPKNQEFLIRLLPRLLAYNPSTVIMLVGDGLFKEKLSDLARSLNVGGRVIFAGSQTDIQAYLSSFDVFAFPSLYEGLSLSLLEAQFNGLPCIISEGVGEESVISLNTKTIALDDISGWVDSLLHGARKNDALIKEKAVLYDLANIGAIASSMF